MVAPRWRADDGGHRRRHLRRVRRRARRRRARRGRAVRGARRGAIDREGVTMELSTYTEFSDAVHRQVAAHAIPANGTIEISHRCPLACSHCYNNLPMGDSSARSLELTTDEHPRLIDGIV